jgi:hypothetical protein
MTLAVLMSPVDEIVVGEPSTVDEGSVEERIPLRMVVAGDLSPSVEEPSTLVAGCVTGDLSPSVEEPSTLVAGCTAERADTEPKLDAG